MRISEFLLFATVLSMASPAVAEEPTYMMRVTPSQRIRAVNTCEMGYPKVAAEEWIFFACCAPELPGQADVSSELTPNGKRSAEAGERRRPVLAARVKVTDDQLRSALVRGRDARQRRPRPVIGRQVGSVDEAGGAGRERSTSVCPAACEGRVLCRRGGLGAGGHVAGPR